MTDPMEALRALQVALNAGVVQMQACNLHSGLKVLLDRPNGVARFTYAKIVGEEVQAIALFVATPPIDGVPCFQIGYAVIEAKRGQGIATAVLQQAIDEMKHGFSRTPMKEFYLEAIVSTENASSNRVAARLISETPKLGDDCFSKEPIFQYLVKVSAPAPGGG